jgi:hypothetical protein
MGRVADRSFRRGIEQCHWEAWLTPKDAKCGAPNVRSKGAVQMSTNKSVYHALTVPLKSVSMSPSAVGGASM